MRFAVLGGLLAAHAANGASFSELRAGLATGYVELSGLIEFNDTLTIPPGHNVTIRGDSNTTTLLDGRGLGPLFFVEGHLRILNLTVSNGKADSGGAFYVLNGALDIIDCTLQGNVARDSGGVVFNHKGTVRFHGGVANKNTAVRGGVVYNDQGTLDISRGLFRDNTATLAGGVGYNFRGSSTLLGTTFRSNAVHNADDDGYGGVFYHEDHDGTAQDVTWEYNMATWGGVMYNDGGTYSVEHGQCSYNEATRGGCFYFSNNKHTISGGTYSYNFAGGLSQGRSWGGVFFDDAPIEVVITRIVCESNTADAGGCYAADGMKEDPQNEPSITNCHFQNNSAPHGGGSIRINEPDIKISTANNHFVDGFSSTGGFLYSAIGKKQIVIRRSTFVRGHALERGGAIFTTTKLTVHDSSFTANEAFKGGVMFIGKDQRPAKFGNADVLVNVIMSGNRATLFGGAIHNERSEKLSLEGTTLMDNVAEVSGGAIYSQALSSVITGDAGSFPSQLIRNSANSGGAISIQAGVSLEVRALSFLSNEAARGALDVGSGGNVVLENTLFASNSATAEGGAVYLEPGAIASIFESTVFNNSATAGGGIYMGPSSSVTSFGSWLTYNRAQTGAAIAASSAVISAETTDWVSNVGDHGGALFLTDSKFVSAGGCIYEQNSALYGGIARLEDGSELFLNETDSGSGNSATYGGGVAFYDYRTTARPPDPPPNVTATALFGWTYATSLASIRATHDGKEVNDREFAKPIRFEAYDDLGNAYITPDIETIELEVQPGSLVGTTLLHLQNGQVNTSGILVSHKPDANVTIVARIAQLNVVTELTVTLRDCFLGEIGNSCRPCTDSAKYSLNPSDETCLNCPKRASCNSERATNVDVKGALIILNAGYWRSGPFSTNIRKCPYAEACRGGVDLLTKEDSCRDKHRGPMCTLCKKEDGSRNKYLLDRSAGKCYKCRNKIWAVLTIVLALAIAFLLVAPIAALIVLSQEHNLLFTDFVRQVSRSFERSWLVRTIDALMPMIKIVFVFSQVVSSEYSTFLFVNYPTIFDKVVVVLSFSQNFAVHSIFASLCVRINHYRELLSVTLVPIAIFASSELIHLVAACRIASDHLRKKIRNYATFVKLITLFIVYSTASIVICTTFRCDDEFRKENDGSEYVNASYLAVDYSISCKKPIHTVYVIYSAVMVFVYPVGVPLYFFCLLWLNRRIINPDAKQLAEDILSRGLEHTVSMKSDNEKESFEASSTGAYSNVVAEGDMRLQALRYTRAVNLCEEYDALRPLSPGLDMLSGNLVASHARLDRKIAHLGFLFCDYSPDCWWFESVECLRRLFLTAVFPAVYSVDNDAGLLYSTFLLSTLFLGVYLAAQPFVDERVNQFAVLMHAALSLILFLTIILYSEERLDRADSARWDRRAIGVVLIFLSTCLGPIMVVFYAQLGGFQLCSTFCRCCRHPKMLGEIDQKTTADDLEDAEQKDSGESSDVTKDCEVVEKLGECASVSTLKNEKGGDCREIPGSVGNDDSGNDDDDEEAQRRKDTGSDVEPLREDPGRDTGPPRGEDPSNDRKPSKYADSPVSNFSGIDFDMCSRASCL